MVRKLMAIAAGGLLAAGCVVVGNANSAHAAEAARISARMKTVADWQIANPSKHHELDWTHGALYPGFMALDGITADSKYRDEMVRIGRKNQWKNWYRTYHADDYAVNQAFLEMYAICRDPQMLKPSVDFADFILTNRPQCAVGQIIHGKSRKFAHLRDDTQMRWWWCDALFMAPPVWAKLYDLTDDARYLDFMVSEWKATSDFLYDKEECLFFRDSKYFPSKKMEANGRKVFWGRGNGWVLGGLVRVLQAMPANHPDHAFFENQFRQMCGKMIAIQPADGVWRASLLDPDSYPIQEASGTSFICYALAWGINEGLLDPAVAEPALRRAYDKLCSFITPEGKLTHVQPIGEDPKKFDTDKTEIYGVGAFLLASSELYKLELLRAKPSAVFNVKNTGTVFLPERTVEIPWSDVARKLPGASPETIVVMEGTSARFLPTQVVMEGGRPVTVLFKTGLHAGQTKRFILVGGMNPAEVVKPVRMTYARFVPERKDDFAWENDRTAYRAYGPALLAVDGPKTGNGIDAWGKNDRGLIVDRLYKETNYHSPALGYAIDAYKVGNGPGCGGSAVYENGAFKQAVTFEKWQTLFTGPVRSSFKLFYATGEVRTFTIDVGEDFYRVETEFPVVAEGACGISMRPVDAQSALKGVGFAAAWEPAQDGVPQQVGVAVVVPGGSDPVDGREAVWIRAPKGKTFTAYAGSCYSSGKDYKTAAEWFRAVETFRKRLDAKIEVK